MNITKIVIQPTDQVDRTGEGLTPPPSTGSTLEEESPSPMESEANAVDVSLTEALSN